MGLSDAVFLNRRSSDVVGLGQGKSAQTANHQQGHSRRQSLTHGLGLLGNFLAVKAVEQRRRAIGQQHGEGDAVGQVALGANQEQQAADQNGKDDLMTGLAGWVTGSVATKNAAAMVPPVVQ